MKDLQERDADEYTVSEISAQSPDMSEADFDSFVVDIRTNGQLVPIWIRGTKVIDGRKRLAACRRIGVQPRVVNLDPSQDAEAVSRALNLLRTHYTISQRAMFAAERVTMTRAHGAAIRDGTLSQLQQGLVSREDAAREAGVNKITVSKAKRVQRDGSAAVVAAVKAGKLTLHAATQITETVPRDEQPAAVRRVIEANKGKPRNTPIASILTGVDVRKDRSIPKPAHEQFARAVQMVDVAADIFEKHADAASMDARRKEFLDTLRRARTVLSRTITALEIAA